MQDNCVSINPQNDDKRKKVKQKVNMGLSRFYVYIYNRIQSIRT